MSMAKNKVYCRRDDIESVIYTLSYLIKGKLPWDPDYFNFEEEKGVPERGKDSEMDQILERKMVMDDSKVRDNLPTDMQILFTYARKLKYKQEPEYQFLIDTLLHLRNKALREEGFIIEHPLFGVPPVQSNSLDSKALESNQQYKSIMSAIKISGLDPNVNTITLQQNKTLNGSKYSMCSNSRDSVNMIHMKENMMTEARKKSTFKKNASSFKFGLGEGNSHTPY